MGMLEKFYYPVYERYNAERNRKLKQADKKIGRLISDLRDKCEECKRIKSTHVLEWREKDVRALHNKIMDLMDDAKWDNVEVSEEEAENLLFECCGGYPKVDKNGARFDGSSWDTNRMTEYSAELLEDWLIKNNDISPLKRNRIEEAIKKYKERAKRLKENM